MLQKDRSAAHQMKYGCFSRKIVKQFLTRNFFAFFRPTITFNFGIRVVVKGIRGYTPYTLKIFLKKLRVPSFSPATAYTPGIYPLSIACTLSFFNDYITVWHWINAFLYAMQANNTPLRQTCLFQFTFGIVLFTASIYNLWQWSS